MLRALLRPVEALALALMGYNLVVALFGWRDRPPAAPGGRSRRFRVVVPAHDEERVVGHLLDDLARQDYPADLFQVWVVADRCRDATSRVAGERGASVAERSEGPDGKGPALDWYLDAHPLAETEALVVVDADNRVPSDLLARFADELDAGGRALQARLDVTNPDASPVATASALSYWASNRMVDLARTNLGWTTMLGGTGMCLSTEALAQAGGFGSGATEDQELSARLFLAGIPVIWLHHLQVRDEKPAAPGVAVRQRSRWATGRREVARRWVPRLLACRSLPAFDLALRLVQPSRTGMAAVSAGLALASAVGMPFLPARVWAAVAAVQVAAPLPFLVREGVPGRYLLRYPLLALLPLLKVGARLTPQRGWYHTPHGG